MKAFLAFTKKEFTEYYRTSKIFILVVVFLLFGMMNPVLAKFTPEIIKASGLDLNLPDPTALDSWAQFFKNVGQMGLIIVVVVFSGMMSNEFSKGTLINILTKGLKRSTVILSKFTVASVLWSLAYLLCLGITTVYTAYFWDLSGLHNVFFAFLGLWLYGEFLIGLLILGGVLFSSTMGSLLLVGATTLGLTILSIFPDFVKFNPMSVASENMALLIGVKDVSSFIPAVLICTALTIFFILSSIFSFNKKQI